MAWLLGLGTFRELLDIMAPGVGVISDAIGGGLTSASGTSMASPTAAGCAALLMAAGEATTPDAIETRLETSSVMVTNPTNGLSFPCIECNCSTLHLTNTTVTDMRTRRCDQVTASNYEIGSTGDVHMKYRDFASLMNGFAMDLGGQLSINQLVP